MTLATVLSTYKMKLFLKVETMLIILAFTITLQIYDQSCSAEKSSSPVAEQCAWALGNVAGEGEELRNILLAQGALLPLARLMLPNKGSTVRTAAWALSNLIKVSNPSIE